ncbi:2-dehydro-3-deoxygalactonokinase [Sphingomonas sp. M1-B02]|uniref:2-dehydro-3-deoxygalactonokinase n=1 Tax=Sphingomonas sp. M1-B02 TaxID=3114300 RepID=UPI002240A65B|nr:2-dehydro-3-deoxygalactonokinase [Sphingomonas sp. S6-11]UZK65445.1 2-dehydro-3-deoxygalactonokinase [Sphingomonas sp. S6-11]
MTQGTFIAVEWGTTRMSARLIATDGSVLDRVIEDVRLVNLDHAGKFSRLRGLRSRWPDAMDPMLLAGMIGSPLGIGSNTQLPCPATARQIATHARQVQLEDLSLTILPGLSCTSRFGDPDVLRGEEVSALGLIDQTEAGDALLLSVPGMHGKWLQLSQARIVSFHTSMTVELYRALEHRSILAPLMTAPACDGNAFRAGLDRAADGRGLARLLFSARTAVMARQFSEKEAASYLWGLLIGADVSENLQSMTDRACFITGGDEVAPLFCAAINYLGMEARLVDNDQLSATGFARLRQMMPELEHSA